MHPRRPKTGAEGITASRHPKSPRSRFHRKPGGCEPTLGLGDGRGDCGRSEAVARSEGGFEHGDPILALDVGDFLRTRDYTGRRREKCNHRAVPEYADDEIRDAVVVDVAGRSD